MTRYLCVFALALAAWAGDNDVVFRSDVSLVRVDAQVVDRDNRAVTGLRAEDFVLREEGRPLKISNFASENMPVDVLLLLDVSASMRPHIQRISSAAHQAMRELADKDRVGIMVFDLSSRVRMPFRSSRDDVERELEKLLKQERFNGGTDITLGLLDAADYVKQNARPEARRAIIIVTDDQTQRDRNEDRVSRALMRADAVLSALLAPDAMHNRSNYPGGGSRGGYPSGRSGGPLGGIILGGGGGPYGRGGRRGGGGPVTNSPRTHSAGTEEIARRSGGDSMPVDYSDALQNTLARIRQRYALHFHLPSDVKPGQERDIEVQLADAAHRRYPDAEVRYRRAYLAPDRPLNAPGTDPVVVGRAGGGSSSSASSSDSDRPVLRRRPAVNEDGSTTNSTGSIASVPRNPETDTAEGSQGGWRPADQSAPAPSTAAKPAASDATKPDDQPTQGGWRKLKPGEQP